MARGRFISKSISLDAKVNQLSTDLARLLWTWMIPHLDARGRFYGEACIVRGFVFPRMADVSVEEIDGYLNEMAELGLLSRYEMDGEQYLFVPQFGSRNIPDKLRQKVLSRDNHTCQYCGGLECLTMDHVIPFSLGGPTEAWNLVTACMNCNCKKGARTPEEANMSLLKREELPCDAE